MKRAAHFVLVMFLGLAARAQNAPRLDFVMGTNGELTISWPVEIIRAVSPRLVASYQIEVGSTVTNWQRHGALLRGEDLPLGRVTSQFPDLRGSSNTFVRVRAVLDFSGRDFGALSLPGLRLSNASFMGANFFDALLDNGSFTNSDFSAADLRFASLRTIAARDSDFAFARLSDANLSSSDFQSASFLLAHLAGADISFCNFVDADLRGAILEDVDISFTSFHRSRIDANTIMDARLRAVWQIVNNQGAGRSFTNMDLSFTDLSSANLTNADFRGANLNGVDIRFSDITGANLTTTNLQQIDWRGTILDSTTILPARSRTIWDILNHPTAGRVLRSQDLTQGFWIDANLERADLVGANFSFGVFVDPILAGAKASNAIFRNAEIHGGNLRDADFRNSFFFDALLEDVDMTGAMTNGANFSGATFRNVIMPNGAVFSN